LSLSLVAVRTKGDTCHHERRPCDGAAAGLLPRMFEGFELSRIDAGEAELRARVGGSGPPLLLPARPSPDHAMWHAVAPRLAGDFTVVCADLRGYGESSKPPTSDDHEPYSKRAMARDQVRLMQELGFDRFFLAGHDRGGRVAYRLALDQPERVAKLALLDIIPTSEMWLPLEDYLRCVSKPETIHAMCEDWADDVRGAPVDAGHFLAEEAPDEIYAGFAAFFGDDRARV
jgi:pimeloyl-ACP methyl ester carboxylesterase